MVGRNCVYGVISVLLGFAAGIAILGVVEFFFAMNVRYHWLAQAHPVALTNFDSDSTVLLHQLQLDYLQALRPPQNFSDLDEPIDYVSAYSASDCANTGSSLSPYWFGVPSCRTRTVLRKRWSRRVVSDVHFTYDEFARRMVPSSQPRSSEVLLFLGCSFTWGEGVEDDETFAHLVTKGLKRPVHAVNLGMGGWGPNELLRMLGKKNDPRLTGIASQSGTAIFTFIDNHMARVQGSLDWLRTPGMEDEPYFYLKDGQLIDGGTFATGRPWLTRLYSLLARSELLKFFHVDLPRAESRDPELLAAIFSECRKILSKRFNVHTFIVAIYPGENQYAARLRPLLENEGIVVFDFSKLDIATLMKGQNIFPGDPHPTPLAHRLYADLLLRELSKREALAKGN